MEVNKAKMEQCKAKRQSAKKAKVASSTISSTNDNDVRVAKDVIRKKIKIDNSSRTGNQIPQLIPSINTTRVG